eukprot:11116996-Alexandrium_andersonii.AAC.1
MLALSCNSRCMLAPLTAEGPHGSRSDVYGAAGHARRSKSLAASAASQHQLLHDSGLHSEVLRGTVGETEAGMAPAINPGPPRA